MLVLIIFLEFIREVKNFYALLLHTCHAIYMKEGYKSMKNFIVIFIVLIFSMQYPVFADQIRMEYDGDEVSWDAEDFIVLQYKETKEILPLSMYYDGYVFAPGEPDREAQIIKVIPLGFNEDDEPYVFINNMKKLSARGIIKGRSDGSADPNGLVSRAEAIAIINRTFGFNDTAIPDFVDLSEADWFYNDVIAAYGAGIIVNDTNFNPCKGVSRQELQVMLERAYDKLGWLRNFSDDYIESEQKIYKDSQLIADYAKKAYVRLNHCLSDNLAIGYNESPDTILSPESAVTRLEICDLLWQCIRYMQYAPSKEAINLGFDKTMPIVDGSTSTYPFTQVVFNRMFKNAHQHPAYPIKHSKSHVSYERLINREVDMLFASVFPSDDIVVLAEDKGIELELIPIAHDAQVFFTNIENSTKGLTIEQISEIYINNSYNNWSELGGSDAGFIPICRNSDSGSHANMQKYFLNGKNIHSDIQRENTSTSMWSVLDDVAVANDEKPGSFALGYSIYYYYQNMLPGLTTRPLDNELKLLEINGVYPTDQTIADGSYPLSDNAYVVMRKDTPADSPARKLADYMLTKSGQDCVKQAGYGQLLY